MRLEGSCHCQRVHFSVESAHPVPYQLCYCSICRKTGGGSGASINLGGDAATLEVRGEEHLATYQAMVEQEGQRVRSKHHRRFCRHCGSHLWAWHEDWPELVHPVAGAIDTGLPTATQRVHMMVGSRAPWVAPPKESERDQHFEGYPDKSLAAFHDERGWTSEPS